MTYSWEQRKLGKIVKEVTRNDPTSTAPIMMITANNGFIEQSERYAFNNAGESLKRYILLEKGELAYNHGASKLRPYGSCFSLIETANARIPFVYHCFSVEGQNPEFMSIELNGADIKNQLRRIVSSGARMDGLLNISFEEYISVSVLLPIIDEQNRINDYFRHLDCLITLHQCKYKLPIYSTCMYSWEQRKLGEISNKVTEKNIFITERETFTNSAELGIVSQKDFFEHDIAKKEKINNYYIVKPDDFVYNPRISVTAPVGPINRNKLGRNGVISPLYTVFHFCDIDCTYLEFFFKSNVWHEYMNYNGDTGARSDRFALRDDVFFDMPISVPNNIEAQKVGKLLDGISKNITLHQRKIFTWIFLILGAIFMIGFTKEADFENALITALQRNGWEQEVLQYPTEDDLIDNWANILFENNRGIDRLNDCPLIRAEMNELLGQINDLRTPLAINGFLNGRTVAITRKNKDDKLHYDKIVSLKIYDRMEIAAGQSRYQIVQQPIFSRRRKVLQDRRGDLMLLINGMPVFHIELKRSGVPVTEASNQIEKYAHEGIFTGIFSMIQVFVAMNPEETIYYANPGPDGRFNPDFYFHWADHNNEPINDWKKIASDLLSIPMAHKMIGFYTVADTGDGILKVMRSYQYRAANKIADQVAKNNWDGSKQLGGYVWHTTGSGKTMTSFKAAQLIACSNDADKVVFLMDRIELGNQSLKAYRAFAGNADNVQATEDTIVLITKLKSKNPKDTLIVSSIQKMSNIKEDAAQVSYAEDLEIIKAQRIVFIIDECHRSTFGEMLYNIKRTFSNAMFFGFSGTPVFEENEKKGSTTVDVFGSELHRYTIADGIRDKNVLGFDPVKVMVYPDKKIREQVALHEAGAATVEEAMADEEKKKVYYYFMDKQSVPMAGEVLADGSYKKGIEDYVPKAQYMTDEYQQAVVDDIAENWLTMSRDYKFHGIFAVSSIPEAVRYYKKFRATVPKLHVTSLFDPNIENDGDIRSLEKIDGLQEMLTDYNERYGMNFDIGGYELFKKDVAARLAHRHPYARVEREKQLDLLIVVNQMLTGFDSKWVNTLYLDKVLKYQDLIQAFSRTNRLFNINEKPFGSIRYYRYPHTMERYIADAVKLYSGDRPQGLFADHLPENIANMNLKYQEMVHLFQQANLPDMDKLPDEIPVRAKFAKLFREFSTYYQAAQIQGFTWYKKEYEFLSDDDVKSVITVVPDRRDYDILLQRYKELRTENNGGGNGGGTPEITFDIDPYLTEQGTGIIDHIYMNSRFEKWLKQLGQADVSPETLEATLEELHKSFAFLPQEEQKLANMFLNDVQSGDVVLEEGKGLHDYIAMYADNIRRRRVRSLYEYFGCEEKLVYNLLDANVSEEHINEYGRFDALKETVVKEKACKYFTAIDGREIKMFRVNNRVDKVLKKFILQGGIDLPEPNR